MNSSLRKLTHAALLAASFALTLVACQTMEGAGRDLQKLGEEIEEAADKD